MGAIRCEPGVWDAFVGLVGWESEGLSMTGIYLVQSQAPIDKLGRMVQGLYRVHRALRSLQPSWMLVLCKVPVYTLSYVAYAFKVVAAVPA